jgi:hypothetical protein
MGIEDVLYFIKVTDGAHPAFQVFDNNDINLVGTDVGKQALQFFSAMQGLAGGCAFIRIDAGNNISFTAGVFFKVTALFSKRKTIPCLLIRAYSDIERGTF